MGRLTLFLPVVFFIGLTIILLFGLDKNPTDLPSALVGEPFPEFDLFYLKSEQDKVDRSELLGEATLVNVWATWCYACRIEHAMLNQLSEQGVRVVGLNYKDKRQDALQWLEQRGDPYEFSVFDVDGLLGIDLGVYGAPETFLLDAEGVIHHRRVGVIDERVWAAEFAQVYQQLRADK
ncbi:DsbE family thiol:disulfide interchange protein [Porticoccaceae bacterium]|nr:DsbE family thiol:disulfide interchange protein [Porticoccaceae bacterium]MDB2344081.1 DsbE family thiol:disulfide interchange protein [Porticoccaceae bacterium]MDB2663980.1 DsbE family thiol:disulfide interchange protein [Porticoccaceae bacterium]